MGPRKIISGATLAPPAEEKRPVFVKISGTEGFHFFFLLESVNHELSQRNVTGIMWPSATSQRAHTEAFDWMSIISAAVEKKAN